MFYDASTNSCVGTNGIVPICWTSPFGGLIEEQDAGIIDGLYGAGVELVDLLNPVSIMQKTIAIAKGLKFAHDAYTIPALLCKLKYDEVDYELLRCFQLDDELNEECQRIIQSRLEGLSEEEVQAYLKAVGNCAEYMKLREQVKEFKK